MRKSCLFVSFAPSRLSLQQRSTGPPRAGEAKSPTQGACPENRNNAAMKTLCHDKNYCYK